MKTIERAPCEDLRQRCKYMQDRETRLAATSCKKEAMKTATTSAATSREIRITTTARSRKMAVAGRSPKTEAVTGKTPITRTRKGTIPKTRHKQRKIAKTLTISVI